MAVQLVIKAVVGTGGNLLKQCLIKRYFFYISISLIKYMVDGANVGYQTGIHDVTHVVNTVNTAILDVHSMKALCNLAS